jgi:site-specific DNA-methyltransferase (adenine-specific)
VTQGSLWTWTNVGSVALSIQPFAEVGDATLYHGESVSLLGQMPEKSVDLIFADPPYNLSNDGYTVHAGKRVSVNKGEWDRSKGVEEDFRFHMDWIAACHRVLKDDGSIWISGTYHSIFACGYALNLQGFRVLNDISWYKPNAAPNLGRRMFTASHETLIWASKSKKSRHTFNYDDMREGDFPKDLIKNPGKQMRSVWAIGTPGKSEKAHGKHPTQKPEALLDRVVRASSNPGDVVLDPFCGSGTTGVVALRHGRKFIGIDLDSDYLRSFAAPRFQDVVAERDSQILFGEI